MLPFHFCCSSYLSLPSHAFRQGWNFGLRFILELSYGDLWLEYFLPPLILFWSPFFPPPNLKPQLLIFLATLFNHSPLNQNPNAPFVPATLLLFTPPPQLQTLFFWSSSPVSLPHLKTPILHLIFIGHIPPPQFFIFTVTSFNPFSHLISFFLFWKLQPSSTVPYLPTGKPNASFSLASLLLF